MVSCGLLESNLSWLNRIGYPTTNYNQANKVAIHNKGIAYASLAEGGISITDIINSKMIGVVKIPNNMNRIDSIEIDKDILFALDVSMGLLVSFSIKDPMKPILINSPIKVTKTNAFSDMSASKGTLIVSGGTNTSSIIDYNLTGELKSIDVDSIAFGNPNVKLHPTAKYGYMGTHRLLSNFGFSSFIIRNSLLEETSNTRLYGAGYSKGGLLFSNFPIRFGVNDDVLTVGYAHHISLFNVKDPINPILLKTIDISFNTIDHFINDVYIVAVGSYPQPSLSLFNVNNISLIYSAFLDKELKPVSVKMWKNYIVIATLQKKLLILDVKKLVKEID